MTPTLLGVPYDAASSFLRGAAAAPRAIREALFSPASNLWTELGIDLGAPDALRDEGDLTIVDGVGGAEVHARIASEVTRLVDAGALPIVLGGDHSVTSGVVRGLSASHRPLTILHFDAHPDLYQAFDGDEWSHASPFARVMEAGLADRLVQIGIRTMNGHQREQAARFGVEVIDMSAWTAGRRPAIAADSLLYLSIDCDAFDPAFAPGVSHREPGGLTPREVIDFIQRAGARIVAADVVECNPSRDVACLTSILAAKLVKEIAGAMRLAVSWPRQPTGGEPGVGMLAPSPTGRSTRD